MDAGHAHHRHPHRWLCQAEHLLLPRRPRHGHGRHLGGRGGERHDGGNGGALGGEGGPGGVPRHLVAARVGENGEVIPTREMYFFSTIARFRLYMTLTYKLPLAVKFCYFIDSFVSCAVLIYTLLLAIYITCVA
jgi:hypothetical protein